MSSYNLLKSYEVRELTPKVVKSKGVSLVDCFYHKGCLIVDSMKDGVLYRGVFIPKAWRFLGYSNSEVGAFMDSIIDEVKARDLKSSYLLLLDAFLPLSIIDSFCGTIETTRLYDSFKISRRSNLSDEIGKLFKPSAYRDVFSEGEKASYKFLVKPYGLQVVVTKDSGKKSTYSFVHKGVIASGRTYGAHKIQVKKDAELLASLVKSKKFNEASNFLNKSYVGYYDIKRILSILSKSVKK